MRSRTLTYGWVVLLIAVPGCMHVKAPPVAGTLSPADGEGASHVFAAQYTETGVVISAASILINTSVEGAHGCWIEYHTHNDSFSAIRNDSGAGFLSLRSDDGTRFLDPIPADSTEEESNGQCTVSAKGFSATRSGDTLTVKFPVRFSSGFRGEKRVYLLASTDYAHSGWQQRGIWKIP